MPKKHLSEAPSVHLPHNCIKSLPQLIHFPTDDHMTSFHVVSVINCADAIIPRHLCAPLCSRETLPRYTARNGIIGPKAVASSTQLILVECLPFFSPSYTHIHSIPHILTRLKSFFQSGECRIMSHIVYTTFPTRGGASFHVFNSLGPLTSESSVISFS